MAPALEEAPNARGVRAHSGSPPAPPDGRRRRTAPTPPTGRSPKTTQWVRWGNRGPFWYLSQHLCQEHPAGLNPMLWSFQSKKAVHNHWFRPEGCPKGKRQASPPTEKGRMADPRVQWDPGHCYVNSQRGVIRICSSHPGPCPCNAALAKPSRTISMCFFFGAALAMQKN